MPLEQLELYQQYLDPIRLRKGLDKCPVCKRLMRSYNKTLDKRLVALAYEIWDWLRINNRKHFKMTEVFTEHQKINDAQKLHYWNIIARSTNSAGYWFITYKGLRFLLCREYLPRNVWIFGNETIEESEELVYVNQLYERWQERRSDYTMDYIIKPVQNETLPVLFRDRPLEKK